MDNPLMTPNKIQKWMNLAEDKSLGRIRVDFDKESARVSHTTQMEPTSPRNCEISSGILDLDRIEDFGELDGENMSFQKSATFNPGEIAGRSTCTEDLMTKIVPLNVAVEKIANIMDTQTSEVKSVMRTSICDSFSFHSKRNLTADEESFMRRDGPVPVHPKQSLISEDTAAKPEDISVGSYFLNRCGDFGRLFKNTDSPDRSNLPSICDGKKSPVLKSSSNVRNTGFKQAHEIDESLDCVPVRQPRDGNNDKMTDKHKNQNQQTIKDFVKPVSKEKHRLTYSSVKCTEKSVVRKHAFSKYASTTIDPVNQYINNPAHYNSKVLSSCQTINSPFNLMTEENESSENSISLSKIADYIAKQSEVSVTEFLNNKKKQQTMKSPLSEVQMNVQDNLVDYSKSAQSSATAGTLNTIMSFDKMRINYDKEIPEIVLTRDSISNIENVKVKTPVRSRSSSSKSPSTLSTVQDNYASFRQSEESGSHSSKGKGSNASNIPSPNTKYTELDKSVDWRYLMGKGFEQRGLAKEKWIEIVTTPAKGFVGVECTVIASVTNLTDSWLTAKFQFESLPNDGKDLCIELPRQPLLLTPGKNEQFNLHITSTVEMKGTLQLSVLLKDTSIERDTEVKQVLEVDVQVPIVQAMSPEGMNKITFPPIQETGNFIKCFVLVSDCPADLQLELSVVEGDSIFAIRNVQEITRTDIKKVLMERQRSTDEVQSGKVKGKALNKQLCRLTSGNAIKVTMKFSPPKLSDLHIAESLVTFNGLLHVNLIGVNSVLRNIDLIGVVGCTKLVINTTSDKLFLTNEPTNIVVSNMGTVPGGWVTKFSYNSTSLPFKAAPARFDICPGGTKTIMLSYTGSEDNVCEGSLSFEDMVTGQRTTIEISGGPEKSRTFPIKTNFSMLSWVRAGRKELSLKNSTDKRVQVRCQVIGEGFSIDLPGGESRGIYSLQFGPCECRPLSVVFAPKTMLPQHATLVLVFEKNGGLTRKIKLFGCASGEPMRWSGLVTYGDTALVRAVNRSPIHLELYNKSTSASFVCAQIHFNVQYCWAEQGSRLAGGRSVVRGKARHRLAVSVEWERVERRARHGAHAHAHAPHAALATLRVLTGHELTRRRILKIIRNESRGNEIDTSLLPEHLKVLTEKLDGEDPTMDELLEEFEETKGSLGELISGLHELTAQIDLPQDYPDEATIVINDETILEHHTLCE